MLGLPEPCLDHRRTAVSRRSGPRSTSSVTATPNCARPHRHRLDVYNDQTPAFILDYDVRELFTELDLAHHLTPSRANGLNSTDYIRTRAPAATVS
ncbi:MAG: SufE family protein [Caldilineaceae bacterium]